MIELRDYQADIYEQCKERFLNGSRGVLIQLPCRAGKSYIMRRMAQDCHGDVLILAHRHELLNQHIEFFDEPNVRFASVFTEAKHLGKYRVPKLLMIDEAHLSQASSYVKVREYYSQCALVGFSATPQRLSGERLELYDSLIQGLGVKELISRGDIAPFDYYAPNIGVDLSNVSTIGGDYNNKQLSEIMCRSKLYGDYIKAYQDLGKERQALAYCVSIKHAKEVCAAFNDAGISAIEVDSKTPKTERKEALAAFKRGDYKILVNCNLISEGITLPEADVCLLLRPTQSLALFIQQSMRCLTPRDGKRATIIDCVGNYQRHGLPDEDREWKLEGKVKHKVCAENGAYTIRQCAECFRVYPATEQACPYCGTIYVPKHKEIQIMKEVELKQIKEQEVIALKERKRQMYRELHGAKTIEDLRKIQIKNGYEQGWIWVQAKLRGIRY